MLNSMMALSTPDIYGSFLKTGMSLYKTPLAELYTLHSSKVLLCVAFAQHALASLLYLKNSAESIKRQNRADRERERAQRKVQRRDELADCGLKLKHRHSRRQRAKLRRRRRRRGYSHLKVLSAVYGAALALVFTNSAMSCRNDF